MNKSLSNTTVILSKNCFQSKQLRSVLNLFSSGFHTTTNKSQVLTVHNMNECVKHMQYAVRGPIVLRAGVIENEILNVSFLIKI